MSISLDKIITEIEDDFPSHLIARKITRHFFHRDSSKLYVITPYWHANMKDIAMNILKKRILKAGCSCLIYQFPVKILSDNIHLTEKYFKEIKGKIEKDIEEVKNKYNFSEIVMIGISLGCVNASMITNHNSNINKLILVVPGDSLSESLWRGIGTRKLKNQIKKHNVNLKELEKDWEKLDPKNNIDGLSNKDIEIYLSRSDKIIPYTNGNHLVKDMRGIGLNPIVFKNKRLGHYLTPLKFIFSKDF